VRIFNGEKPQDIPVRRGVGVYMSNWRALQKWGLKESNLSPGNIVINRQPTFWEVYRRYVASGFFLLLVQTAIIVALLWHWRKRKRAQKGLSLANERLRLAIETAGAVSWHKDFETDLSTWSGDLQHLFGVSTGRFSTKFGELVRHVHRR